MNSHTFHTSVYDLLFLGTIFIGLTFALLLWFVKNPNLAANRFLALVLMVVGLWMTRMLGTDLRVEPYQSYWNRLPLQFSLALGPLLYFYVFKLTRPEHRFRWTDLLHFVPASVQAVTLTQQNTYWPLLTFISVAIYLYLSHSLIKSFYQRQNFNEDSDRYRHKFQWLHRLLVAFGLLWLLWIPYAAVDYFGYRWQLRVSAYYPLYILLAGMVIWIGITAFLRSAREGSVENPVLKSPVSTKLRQKAAWLKKAMEGGLYYRDTELSLNSLAEKLEINPRELSHIINAGLKKNFADFVNEYRVKEVARKMRDAAYDHITLLGIAYESGFNSQSTFNRIFKQMTGKSPVEYKNGLKKEYPNHDLGSRRHFAPVALYPETAPGWSQNKLNGNFMIRNYFKSAWRHLKRHKLYSIINMAGLAMGICGCLIIYLIVNFEFSFDTFHPDKDRIYCVDISSPNSRTGNREHMNSIPPPMPDAIRNDLTGLEKQAAFQPYQPKVKIMEGGKMIRQFDEADAILAQPDYFDILPYTWLSGSKKTALADPLTVVLTQSRAKTYFGNLPPDQMIGKTIIYNDSLMVRVTGIIKDWTQNSDFNFSDFISFSTIKNRFLIHQFPQGRWDMLYGTQELVKLPVAVKPSQIDAQLRSLLKKYMDPDPHSQMQIQLQPFTGIHFHSEYGGPGRKADLRVLYILSAVAVFILFIAAINFINLSTAQSIQRTKEIGILKVLGSEKGNILFQFLTETFMLALMAVAIALIAIKPLLSLFAAYIPPGVQFHFTDYANWLFLAGIAIFTTLLAGLYPARLLTAFRPVSSLKGRVSERADNKGRLRKSLIVFQFTVSLLFIIGTIAINNQIRYMQNKDLGIKTNNIIVLRMVFSMQRPGKPNLLAEQIKQLPGVEQAIAEGPPPVSRGHMGAPMRLRGPLEWSMDSYIYPGDEHFVPFYHMKIIAGRNLLHSDSAREYLINETAAKALGFRDPRDAVGKLLISGAGNKGYPIAGVVADFYESSFFNKIIPCVILNDPERQMGVALKLTPAEFKKGDLPLLINRIAKEWKKVYPEEPFDYAFLGDSIEKMYESEQQTAWLMRTATFITIFISCMGLFGLAMFTTERRAKEISIRKVLGASVADILTMLNKEVVVLIAISLLIASPVAWYFIHQWLQNFAYHTNLGFWVFILAGAGALFIALATISFRTIRSATANPVEGLRNE